MNSDINFIAGVLRDVAEVSRENARVLGAASVAERLTSDVPALIKRAEAAEVEVARLRTQVDELIGRPEYPPTGEPPDEIWLQWYGNGDGDYLNTGDGPACTWSTDQVFEGDVRYVRSAE
jgi:hypothetical protein